MASLAIRIKSWWRGWLDSNSKGSGASTPESEAQARPEKGVRLASDKPRTEPDEDLLEYAPFAEHLADSIIRMSPREGFVVGLFGHWGMGKSSMLNFVKYYLEHAASDSEVGASQVTYRPPVVVEFNPWWFPSREELTKTFIAQLTETLAPHVAESDKFREDMATLATLCSALPYTGFRALEEIGTQLRDYQSKVPDLKTRIARILENEGRKIIVMVDDIDRLPVDEIREIFRLIKVVADLPYVIYMLAFDRAIVAEALTEEYGVVGDSFLDKIIQVPINLPIPDRSVLMRLFIEQLVVIVRDEEAEKFDRSRWREVFHNISAAFLITPRDAIRLSNALAITYSAVAGEVNLVDFVALESLRLFQNEVYETIKDYKQEFTALPSQERKILVREFHRNWHGDLASRSTPNEMGAVEKIVKSLFPIFEWALGDLPPDDFPYEERPWRAELRICSPDIFDVYFRLAIPDYSVSRAELDQIVESAADPVAFGQYMLELTGQPGPSGLSRVVPALERLTDLDFDEVDRQKICNMVASWLDIGDNLIEKKDETFGFWGFITISNSVRVQWLIEKCLRQMNQEERVTCLREAIASGAALATAVEIVARLGEQHGKYGGSPEPKGHVLIKEESLRLLEEECLEGIEKEAQQGTLLSTPELVRVLYRWCDWSDPDVVRGWLSKNLYSHENMLLFLKAFLPDEIVETHSKKDLLIGRYYARIADFVIMEQFDDLLQSVLERADLPEKDQKRVELVLSPPAAELPGNQTDEDVT